MAVESSQSPCGGERLCRRVHERRRTRPRSPRRVHLLRPRGRGLRRARARQGARGRRQERLDRRRGHPRRRGGLARQCMGRDRGRHGRRVRAQPGLGRVERVQRGGSAHAIDLNKRIVPVLRRPVDGLRIPPALERPNWVYSRPEDDFDASVAALVEALELDEAWIERHARLTLRTGEWLRGERDGSYLLRGTDLREAERWLDDAGSHREKPTADQVTYITAGPARGGTAPAQPARGCRDRARGHRRPRGRRRRAAAARRRPSSGRRTRAGPSRAVDRGAVARPDPRACGTRCSGRHPAGVPEALYALRRAVSPPAGRRCSAPTARVDSPTSSSRRRPPRRGRRLRRTRRRLGPEHGAALVRLQDERRGSAPSSSAPTGRRLLTASDGGAARIWDGSTGHPLRRLGKPSNVAALATWGAGGRRILTSGRAVACLGPEPGRAPPFRLSGPTPFPLSSHMSLDGRRAVDPGRGGKAVLWNLVTRTSVDAAPAARRRPGPARVVAA